MGVVENFNNGFIDLDGTEPTPLALINIVGILPKQLHVKEGRDIRECRVKFYNTRNEAADNFTLTYSSQKGNEPDIILETKNTQTIPEPYDSCRVISNEITEKHELRIYF